MLLSIRWHLAMSRLKRLAVILCLTSNEGGLRIQKYHPVCVIRTKKKHAQAPAICAKSQDVLIHS